MEELLAARFEKLVLDLLPGAMKVRECCDQLISAYSEQHRHYHNLCHLNALFNDLDHFDVSTSYIELAVWYHDVVYKPGSKRNESKSAELSRDHLRMLGFTEDFIRRVAYMVECTADHQFEGDDPELQIFLDADMAILGSEPSAYEAYMEALRREFQKIPKFLYRRGRSKFLRNVLNQDKIYQSQVFYDAYEGQARKNIEKELLNL